MLFTKKSMSVLVLLLTVACASKTKVKDADYNSSPRATNSDETQTLTLENAAAKETKASFFVEIKFDKGSAKLSESAKKSLQAIINKGNEAGEIDDLIVLSWSDSEYPNKNISKLSDHQRKLAKKRNKSVERYADSIADLDVDTYNMAERPNSLTKWIKTKDQRIKNSLVEAGLDRDPDAKLFASKASSSVILVKLKEKNKYKDTY